LIRTGQGREVFDRLQREGVIVRPMDVYGLPDHIRITVGTREENQRCILALATVLQSVAQNAASGSGE
jgi:histidinol-phosphate aminotransferase